MIRRYAPAAVIAALALTACGHAVPGANPFDNAVMPSHAHPVPCATPACIAADAQRDLPALAARTGIVVTRSECQAATVAFAHAGTFTVRCAAYAGTRKTKGTVVLTLAAGKSWQASGT